MNTRQACTPPTVRAIAAALAVAAAPWACAQTEIAFSLIPGSPQQITAAVPVPGNPNRILALTRFGGVRMVDLAANTFLPGTVAAFSSDGSSNGTTGLAIHPRFADNGVFYAWRGISVIQFRMLGDPLSSTQADPAYTTVIRIPNLGGQHVGGWIGFAPNDADGVLWISTGDSHTSANGQRTDNLFGRILRIDVDGPDNIPGNADDDAFPADPNRHYAIPPNNPFVGTEGDDEIWAYGLRNPWRFSIDRVTNALWIADVGQSVKEEINYAPLNFAGQNYGWRCMEGTSCTGLAGCVCNLGLRAPIYEYGHEFDRCSIIGGPVYRGCSMPWLRGAYLFTDFCTNELFSMRYAPGTGITELINRHDEIEPPDGSVDVGSTTAIVEDAQGELYIIDWWGFVFRIVDAANADCNSNGRNDACDILAGVPDLNGNGRPDVCDPPDCPADFDESGGVDGADVEAFYLAWEASSARADTNLDGGVDGGDVETFFILWEAGGC